MVVLFKPLKYSEFLLQKYYKWFNDEDVRRYLDPKTPRNTDDIRSWLQSVGCGGRSDAVYYSIFVVHWLRRILVGHVGLKDIKHPGSSAYVGLIIGEKNYWKRGVGRKALDKILRKARSRGISCIFAKIHKDNIPSIKLFTREGFSFDKEEDEGWYIYKLIFV